MNLTTREIEELCDSYARSLNFYYEELYYMENHEEEDNNGRPFTIDILRLKYQSACEHLIDLCEARVRDMDELLEKSRESKKR